MSFSLMDLIGPGDRPEELNLGDDEPMPHLDPDNPKSFQLVMRRKRQAALLQAMLRSQGYDDLARMASVRQQGERSVY